ncbi:MAG: hypothetical protein DRJ09_05880 [Bacteroidetes bacterium]|nr:MAG: hypothetical protein DRJ09_05880 [Bacteroidota bacterium]
MEFYKHTNNEWQNDYSWQEIAIIRLFDYINYEGLHLNDPNLSNRIVISRPIENLWHAIRFGRCNCNEAFFLDMLYLFRQLNGRLKQSIPSPKKVYSLDVETSFRFR